MDPRLVYMGAIPSAKREPHLMTDRPPRHRAIMDLNRDEWLNALGMDAADIPRAVIMEGSWWRAQRTAWRLSYLDEVREVAFPDMFYGLWQGSPVVYSCVYGAPRAVELAHLFGVLGTPRMVMIGTCGALDPRLSTGDVVVPSQAVAQEVVAHLYEGVAEDTGIVLSDPDLTELGHPNPQGTNPSRCGQRRRIRDRTRDNSRYQLTTDATIRHRGTNKITVPR